MSKYQPRKLDKDDLKEIVFGESTTVVESICSDEVAPEYKKYQEIILSEIPQKKYNNVLSIGFELNCFAQGLPGNNILAVNILPQPATQSKVDSNSRIKFIQSSIFDLSQKTTEKYDLVIITYILYPQNIGKTHNLIYLIRDNLILDNGVLICCHAKEWYNVRFPYLMLEYYLFEYKQYTHRLEVYVK